MAKKSKIEIPQLDINIGEVEMQAKKPACKKPAKAKEENKPATKKEKSFDIEKALERLDEINTELSKPGTSLKDSLTLYKEGVELAEKCKTNLEGVEKEIQILSEE